MIVHRATHDNLGHRQVFHYLDKSTFESELIPRSQYRKIYVRQTHSTSFPPVDRMYGFWLRKLRPEINTVGRRYNEHCLSKVSSLNDWNHDERMLKIQLGGRGTVGVIRYRSGPENSVLRLGFDSMFNAMVQFEGTQL